jgi:hypothetical protein
VGQGKVLELITKIDDLFAETLVGGVDDHAPWNAISNLRKKGGHLVFIRAEAWCSSKNPLKRARAAAILAQLGIYYRHRTPYISPQWVFRDRSFDLITCMLKAETDVYAISAEVTALGQLDNLAAVPIIAKYVHHPHENVRYSVAYALGCYHDDPTSIKVLQDLVEDIDQDVRDWAIFGLGVLGNADSEEIRVTFLKHLDDPFLDARIEAAAALGKRRDTRLAKPLILMLKRDGALNGIIEAAKELLEFSDDRPDWFENEYISAIEARFPDTQ